MLVLTRKAGERIVIGTEIIIEVLSIDSRGYTRLGITAPETTPIFREEIFKKMKAQGEEPKEFITINYPKNKRD